MPALILVSLLMIGPSTAHAELFPASAMTVLFAGQQGAEEFAQPKSNADGFFSGNVVEAEADHLVVSRTILGKTPERRRFVVNGSTKVEGRLRSKVRVTVRYAPSADGDVALSVLVREPAADGKGAEKKK